MQRHKITNDFYLDEFTRSQTAARYGIDNSLSVSGPTYANLRRLCRDVLQPIRNYLGVTVSVSSGYRCLALNRKIGGADSSQHVPALAADINAAGKTPMELARDIVDLKMRREINFDQLILEFGQWVHISTPSRSGFERSEILTAVKVPRKFRKPKTVYVRGLHTQEDALKIAQGRAL